MSAGDRLKVEMKINAEKDKAIITIHKPSGNITLSNILYAIKNLVEEIYEDIIDASKN